MNVEIYNITRAFTKYISYIPYIPIVLNITEIQYPPIFIFIISTKTLIQNTSPEQNFTYH